MSRTQSYNLKLIVETMQQEIMTSVNIILTPLLEYLIASTRPSGLTANEILAYNNAMTKIALLLSTGINNNYFTQPDSNGIMQLKTVISCDSDSVVGYINLYSLHSDPILFTYTTDPISHSIVMVPTTPFSINNVPALSFLTAFHIFNTDCINAKSVQN